MNITDFLVVWGSLMAYSITFSTIGTTLPIWFAAIPLLVAFFTLMLCESEMEYLDDLKNLSQ